MAVIHNPDATITMPFGMEVWDDQPDPIARTVQDIIDAQNVELIDLRSALSKALVQRDTWVVIAAALAMVTGYLIGVIV